MDFFPYGSIWQLIQFKPGILPKAAVPLVSSFVLLALEFIVLEGDLAGKKQVQCPLFLWAVFTFVFPDLSSCGAWAEVSGELDGPFSSQRVLKLAQSNCPTTAATSLKKAVW